MDDITTAIAIMDEKGRRLAGGSVGLWEKDWDWLRELLLAIKLKAEKDETIIEGMTIAHLTI